MAELKIIKQLHYGKKWSRRRIARELGMSRNTVARALGGQVTGEYRQRQARSRRVAETIEPVIRDLLAQERDRATPVKQRLTAAQIERILRGAHGYSGGAATVRRAVARVRATEGDVLARAMVPLCYAPGVDAQVDFLEAAIDFPTGRERRYFLLVRACYSARPFVWQAPAANQEALLEGLARAFEHFGGVFHNLWFDNLTPAVKRVLTSRAREVQAPFAACQAHYGFEAEFCGVGKGNEKGGVENGVGYFRRSALCPLPEVEDDASLDLHLAGWMAGELDRRAAGQAGTVGQRWSEEQSGLMPLPGVPFTGYRSSTPKVSAYSLVQAGRNFYSVPVSFVGQRVTLRWYSRHVEIYSGAERIAEHRRLYGQGEVAFELAHYLPLLARKARAFDRAAPVVAARAGWPETYPRLLAILRSREGEAAGTRAFIAVLALHAHYGQAEVSIAVRRALSHAEPSLAVVRLHLDGLQQAKAPRETLTTLAAGLPQVEVASSQVADYDRLCPGAVTL
jgi:transposase